MSYKQMDAETNLMWDALTDFKLEIIFIRCSQLRFNSSKIGLLSNEASNHSCFVHFIFLNRGKFQN